MSILDSGRARSLLTGCIGLVLRATRNGFALLGLLVLLAVGLMVARPDLRASTETRLMGWLQERHIVQTGIEVEPEAIERATAAPLAELPREQALLAQWLARKYRVAPEPLAALVAEAHTIGARSKLDPTLILAVMAVESGFNPFAQSPVGAQGLMQVMTKVHTDKYEDFGGKLAAFDPVTNLRVGVKVLKECIARAGSIPGGLRHYVGAANLEHDGGYAEKVLTEHLRLQRVAAGLSTAANHPVELPPEFRHAPEAAPQDADSDENVALLTQQS